MVKVMSRSEMMMMIARLLLVTLLLGVLPTHAWAENEPMELKNLNVSVWPEYDDPRVLVILEGTFVNTSNAPYSGPVKWNIPDAGEIEVGMACEIVNGGGHSCQPYQQTKKGEWIELTCKTTKSIKPGEEYPVFLEYYYNPLEGAVDKKFNFPYQPSYNIQALSIAVQQPLKASNFSVTPPANSTNVDQGGFTVHNYLFSNQTPKDKISLNIAYTKNDPAPSVQKQTDDSSGSPSASGGLVTTSSFKDTKVLVPMVFSLVLLTGFIVYAVMKNKQPVPTPTKKHPKKNNKKSNSKSEPAKAPEAIEEFHKLRQQLINGTISEETYFELHDEISQYYKD